MSDWKKQLKHVLAGKGSALTRDLLRKEVEEVVEQAFAQINGEIANIESVHALIGKKEFLLPPFHTPHMQPVIEVFKAGQKIFAYTVFVEIGDDMSYSPKARFSNQHVRDVMNVPQSDYLGDPGLYQEEYLYINNILTPAEICDHFTAKLVENYPLD